MAQLLCGCLGCSELVKPICEVVWVRSKLLSSGDMDLGPVHPLQAMLKHGTIDLSENVPPDVDLQVGRYTDNVRVKGRVMDLAERQPIWDLG